MGNTLPITSVPKPTESRAIIYIYSMGMLGKLQVEKDGIATVPSSLDGSVPDCVFGAAVDSISERCCSFRGGLVAFYVALSQILLLSWIIFGFIVSKYVLPFPFYDSMNIIIMGALELLVLSSTGHMRHKEESKLVSDLLAILHPWRSEYGIIAKLRKSRGKFIIGDSLQEKSVTCYCILLEKITPGYDLGTRSLSTFTDIESDDEAPDV